MCVFSISECNPDLCEFDVPSCGEDQTVIASKTNDSCCLTHMCSKLANEFLFHYQRLADKNAVLTAYMCVLSSVLHLY